MMQAPTWNEFVGFMKHVQFVVKSPYLVARIINGFRRSLVMNQPVLRSIELAITYRCQAACEFCYSDTLLNRGRKELSIKEIRQFWDECLKLGAIHVNITGGEPMIRKDWDEAIAACNPERTIVSMVSNGELLTRKNVRRAKNAGLRYLQISLDSANPEIHDESRKVKNLFEKAIRGLEYAKEEGITVSLSTVVTNENAPTREVWKMIDLAEKYDVFLLLNLAAMAGRWQSNRDCILTPKTMEYVRQFRQHPVVRQNTMYNFRMKAGCPAGTEKFYVTAYGDVTPCPLTHISYGNIREKSAKQIWTRMLETNPYNLHSTKCLRCENTEYYRKYIDPLADLIEQGMQVPIPIENHPAWEQRHIPISV